MLARVIVYFSKSNTHSPSTAAVRPLDPSLSASKRKLSSTEESASSNCAKNSIPSFLKSVIEVSLPTGSTIVNEPLAGQGGWRSSEALLVEKFSDPSIGMLNSVKYEVISYPSNETHVAEYAPSKFSAVRAALSISLSSFEQIRKPSAIMLKSIMLFFSFFYVFDFFLKIPFYLFVM